MTNLNACLTQDFFGGEKLLSQCLDILAAFVANSVTAQNPVPLSMVARFLTEKLIIQLGHSLNCPQNAAAQQAEPSTAWRFPL
jgi:hypothetical protein